METVLVKGVIVEAAVVKTVVTKKRAVLALAILPLFVASLAACSASPAPVHTATAAERCTPSSAKISWQKADPTLSQPLATGVKVEVSTSGGVTSSANEIANPVKLGFDNVSVPGASSTTSAAAWKSGLVTSLRRTGQVPKDFGGKLDLPDAGIEPAQNQRGKILVVQEVTSISVPFSASCAGEKPFTGIVSGPVDNVAISTIVVSCTAPASKHASAAVALASSLVPTYCDDV